MHAREYIIFYILLLLLLYVGTANGRGVHNIISGFLMRPTHLTYTRALLITP